LNNDNTLQYHYRLSNIDFVSISKSKKILLRKKKRNKAKQYVLIRNECEHINNVHSSCSYSSSHIWRALSLMKYKRECEKEWTKREKKYVCKRIHHLYSSILTSFVYRILLLFIQLAIVVAWQPNEREYRSFEGYLLLSIYSSVTFI